MLIFMGLIWASFLALMAGSYTSWSPLVVFGAMFSLWLLPIIFITIKDMLASRRGARPAD
jgi:hypothetical protein